MRDKAKEKGKEKEKEVGLKTGEEFKKVRRIWVWVVGVAGDQR